MDLKNKVALVTGASRGIGKEVAIKLVEHGMRVVGCGRRFELLKELADELNNKGPGNMLPLQCDLNKEDEILNMFATIKEKYGALHVVINNAGKAITENVLSGTTDLWRSVLNLNVLATAIVARESFKLMQETKVTEGNIVFMNSTIGHKVLESVDMLDFYTIAKHAVTAMVKVFRKEINAVAPHIRCTSLSPGTTRTECFYESMGKEAAENLYKNINSLPATDVADAVVYILTTPAHLGINELELEAAFNTVDAK